MVFPAATPKPFPGTIREDNLIPQPQEAGQFVATGSNGTTAVTKDGPKAKPWAHFVAGGYARSQISRI
jgi:hypothetical protein